MEDVEVLEKDPGTAYLGNWLWLPKMKVHPEVIKASLTLVGGPRPLHAWMATRHHILVPRRYYEEDVLHELQIPLVRLLPDASLTYAPFGSKIELWERPETNQVEMVSAALEALKQFPGTSLLVGCGKGKTRVALELAARLQQRTLILIPSTTQVRQWAEEIEACLTFEGRIGKLTSTKSDWEQDIAIGMMDTIVSRFLDLPPEFYHRWGLVIFDEVHSLGAQEKSVLAGLFPGKRLGITATYRRSDGRDAVYKYHIGPPCYTATEQEIRPKISFLYTPVTPPLSDSGRQELPDECYSHRRERGEDGEVRLVPTTINHGLLCGWLDGRPERAEFIVRSIREDLSEGKKIVVLSKRKEFIHQMKNVFGDIAVAIDVDTDEDQRVLLIRGSRVAFCTDRIGAQAVNDPQLDTLYLVHATKSDTQIIQAFGRVQRVVKNKGEVAVRVFEDRFIWPIHKLCKQTRKIIGDLGYTYTLVPYQES